KYARRAIAANRDVVMPAPIRYLANSDMNPTMSGSGACLRLLVRPAIRSLVCDGQIAYAHCWPLALRNSKRHISGIRPEMNLQKRKRRPEAAFRSSLN